MKDEPKEFSREELDNALIDLDDLMHRTLLQDQYVLLKDSAKALYDGVWLYGDGIDIGIEYKYLTKEVMTTINEYFIPRTTEINDNGFEFKIGDVPIRVKFIHRKYDFFKYFDRRMYGPEDYQIPNNFEKYYKAKGIIK